MRRSPALRPTTPTALARRDRERPLSANIAPDWCSGSSRRISPFFLRYCGQLPVSAIVLGLYVPSGADARRLPRHLARSPPTRALSPVWRCWPRSMPPASFDLPEPVGRNLIHGTGSFSPSSSQRWLCGWQALFMPPSCKVVECRPHTAIFDAGRARGHEQRPRRRRIRRCRRWRRRLPRRSSEPTEREIIVETSVAQIVLSNRGGRVLHWRLKDYRTPAGRTG